MVSSQLSFVSEKAALRDQARKIRAQCDPALGVAMAAMVMRDCLPPDGAVVGGFFPLPGEMNIGPLLAALAGAHTIAIPETPPLGAPLIFREWRMGAPLITGRFNTRHPAGAVLMPDFLLVPLLAYDADGNRLGHGGGYYDRTMATLPHAFRLGCAFSAQQMPAIPTAGHDLPLHAVATEKGVTRFNPP